MKDLRVTDQILARFALDRLVLFVFQSNVQLELTMEKQQKFGLRLG